MLKETLKDLEGCWDRKALNLNVWGFQIQPHTKWLGEAYTSEEINNFEIKYDLLLPDDLVELLKLTKGLDTPQIHIKHNKTKMEWKLDLNLSQPLTANEFQDFDNFHILSQSDVLINLYSHRFVVCNKNTRSKESKILSIYNGEIIPYAASLEKYLITELK
jgi:hypothetical protein